MGLVQSKIALQMLPYLGKVCFFLRPTTLDFENQRTSIRVSGDVAKIHYTGRIDKGMMQWFAGDGYLTLRTPDGLDLDVEVHLKNTGQQADYRRIKPQALAIDVRKYLREVKEKWHKGELVDFEIWIPCDTSVFLAFPRGEAGSQIVQENFIETVIEVSKKPEYREVVIEKYELPRSLQGLLPLESASITKNGQEIPLRIDLVHTDSCSVSINTAKLDNLGHIVGDLQGGEPHLKMYQPEIRIPLSFVEPHDRYIIEFRTNKS